MPDPRTPSLTRLRLTFATARTLACVSVLDLGRIWERSLRRAAVPLRYSQGFNPRPRMQFAAPLPTGCGGEAELLDIWLDEPRTPDEITAALEGKLPPDLHLRRVEAVAPDAPLLADRLRASAYRLLLRGVDPASAEQAIRALLAREEVLRPRRGRRRDRMYDLRPLILELRVAPAGEPWDVALWMRLRAEAGATGRPDEVLAALGFDDLPRRCTRERLILAGEEAADD